MATATRIKHSKLDHVSLNPGLTIIHPDPDVAQKVSSDDIKVDVVAVPGLGADPQWTWKSSNKVDWLRDGNMLHRTIPSARIMIFEYESQWFGKGSIDQKLLNVANQLLRALLHRRQRGSTRPIVFVCHCLGGIVVEKALINAKLRQSEYPEISTSVVGCVFLGTPFRGTKSQTKASALAEMAQTVGLGKESGLVKLLEQGSEALKDYLEQFAHLAKESNMRVFCFFEQHKTDLTRLLSKSFPIKHEEIIVDEDSATSEAFEKDSLASDHFELNKFFGPKDGRYVAVSNEIDTIVQKARTILKSRKNASRETLIDESTFQRLLEDLRVTVVKRDMEESVKGRPASQASWALSNAKYLQWKDQNTSQTLWIHGDAGQGQAVIASSLIDDLQQKSNEDGVFLAYFFCDEKDSHRRNVIDVLKLLICQMLVKERELAEHLLVDHNKGKKGSQKSQSLDSVSVATVFKNLQAILKNSLVRKAHFIVNGLDETDQQSREEFFDLMEASADEEQEGDDSVVKWVFLSRSGRPAIQKRLQKALTIDMGDDENFRHVKDAVKAEISGQVDKLAKEKNYNAGLVYFVKKHIFSKADGNYIYVNLMIQELRNLPSTQSSISNVRKFLEGFPYGLTDMFEYIRHRVLSSGSEDIEHTKEIFRCLILAQRAPTIFELALMADLPFEVRQDELALRAHIVRCGAYITVSEDESKTVAWIDVAAREHLERHARDELSLELNDVQHGIIALRCLDYIRSNAPEQQEQQDDNDVTPEQADVPVDNEESTTAVEANDIPGSNHPEEEEEPIDEIDKTSSDQPPDGEDSPIQPEDDNVPAQEVLSENDQHAEVESNPEDDNIAEAPSETPTLLKYPYDCWLEHAKLGEVDVVEEFNLNDEFWSEDSSSRAAWWKQYGELNGFNGMTYTTPLHIAACFGYTALVDHLLDNGRIAELKAVDSWGFRPLYWACHDGKIDLVQRLVKAGADVNMPRNEGNITALWKAAQLGHLDIVEYLLEQGAMTDIQDDELGTPLYVASENGSVPVIRCLLQRGADVNMVGGLHRRALNAAAFFGQIEIVQLLLQQNVKVDPDEEYKYGSALGAAARKGHGDISRLLIQKGWNVNKNFKPYHSALVAAATYGHVEVVEALLLGNADAKSRQLALENASKNGKTDVVEELLKYSHHLPHQKAFLNAASYGRNDVLKVLQKLGTNQEMLNTALYQASDAEQNSTVELLLEFGASADAEGKDYGNALIAAAYDSNEELIQILLNNKADPNKLDQTWGSALQVTASYGELETVQTLLNYGAIVNTEAIGKYGSVLQAACYSGNKALVELLIAHGADINFQGGEYGSALMAASEQGCDEIVEVLVKGGADLSVRSPEDGSPIMVSAGYSLQKETMAILLDHGAEIDAKGEDGETALIATACSGDAEGLKLLLERGADIHASGDEYGTALHAAAAEGDEECLPVLISHGADINHESGPWHTPLQAAAQAADLDCVNLLLDAGADVNLSGGFYGSALQAAAFNGSPECVQRLLEAGADVDHEGGEYGCALQAAAFSGDSISLGTLLNKGANVNLEGGVYNSPLQGAAARFGNEASVKPLLEHGANALALGGLYGSALQAAAVSGDIATWDMLLKHGADVHAPGGKYGTVLQAASLKGETDFVRQLLERSVDVNKEAGKYSTALQAAASSGQLEIVKMLCEHHANANIQGGLYGNALNAAVSRGNTEVLSVLLDKSPSEYMLDESLLKAVYYRQDEAVDMLLSRGASAEARSEELGSTLDILRTDKAEDVNSDFGGDNYDSDDESEEDDDDEEEGSDDGDDQNQDAEGDTEAEPAPQIEPDGDQSVQSVDLGELAVEEEGKGKIQRLLEDALAKIKANPRLRRAGDVLHRIIPPGQKTANTSAEVTKGQPEHLQTENIAGTDHAFESVQQSTAGATSAIYGAYDNGNQFPGHQRYTDGHVDYSIGQHVPPANTYSSQSAYDNHQEGIPPQEPYANRPTYTSQPSSYSGAAYNNQASAYSAQPHGIPPQEPYGSQPTYVNQPYSPPMNTDTSYQGFGTHAQTPPAQQQQDLYSHQQVLANQFPYSAPQPSYPTQQASYPPQQASYPLQQASYPPQQTSYPGRPTYSGQSSYNNNYNNNNNNNIVQPTPPPLADKPPPAASSSSSSNTFLGQQVSADSVDVAMLKAREKASKFGSSVSKFWK